MKKPLVQWEASAPGLPTEKFVATGSKTAMVMAVREAYRARHGSFPHTLQPRG